MGKLRFEHDGIKDKLLTLDLNITLSFWFFFLWKPLHFHPDFHGSWTFKLYGMWLCRSFNYSSVFTLSADCNTGYLLKSNGLFVLFCSDRLISVTNQQGSNDRFSTSSGVLNFFCIWTCKISTSHCYLFFQSSNMSVFSGMHMSITNKIRLKLIFKKFGNIETYF